VIWQEKECMGGTKSNKKSMAPYQKDEQKKHKKIAGGTNLQLDGGKIWWGFGQDGC
jgi:hypothetical protein